MIITLESLLWTLPIIFMIHEFEEIIIFNPWYRKNEFWLVGKHPKLEKIYKIAKSST